MHYGYKIQKHKKCESFGADVVRSYRRKLKLASSLECLTPNITLSHSREFTCLFLLELKCSFQLFFRYDIFPLYSP